MPYESKLQNLNEIDLFTQPYPAAQRATPFFSMSHPPDCRQSFGGNPAAPAVPQAEKGIVLPELSCHRVPPAGAARPLVHKILAMLLLQRTDTRSFGTCRRGTFRNPYLTQKNHVQIFFKVCMRVGAPDTQNNNPNPRKSVVFIICPL